MPSRKEDICQANLPSVSLEKFLRYLMLCLKVGISQANLLGVSFALQEVFKAFDVRPQDGYMLDRPFKYYSHFTGSF